MTLRIRAVVVKQMPESVDVKGGQAFLRSLEGCMSVSRPSIVFDCSKVLQMDRSAVHLLLCCLEEAMKSNGDVKLAAIPPGARAILELTGANRLFEIYETNADAVSSFHRPSLFAAPSAFVPGSSLRTAER